MAEEGNIPQFLCSVIALGEDEIHDVSSFIRKKIEHVPCAVFMNAPEFYFFIISSVR
mgnify:CR=1 FL=1